MRTAKRQKGIAAVMVAISILTAATLMTFFSARVIATDYKIYKNSYDRTAAENAAQAGFSYALGYLNQSPYTYLTITTLPTSVEGTDTYYILPTGTLSNNAVYQAGYRLNTDINTLIIRSIGYSPNGTATDYSDRTAKVTVQAVAKRYSVGNSITIPAMAIGQVTMDGSSSITNTTLGLQKTVTTGSTLTFSSKNSGTYYTNSLGLETPGSSKSLGIKSDVTQNDSTMGGYTASTLQNAYLGSQLTDFQSMATMNINCTANATFDKNSNDADCTCNGTKCSSVGDISNSTGQIIYFNMNGKNLNFNNGFLLGSTNAPVTVVIANAGQTTIAGANESGATINGSVYSDSSLRLAGNGQIKGLAFTSADLEVAGTPATSRITGAAIAGTTLSTSGNGRVLYDSASVSNTSIQYYGVVPGSWRDF